MRMTKHWSFWTWTTATLLKLRIDATVFSLGDLVAHKKMWTYEYAKGCRMQQEMILAYT